MPKWRSPGMNERKNILVTGAGGFLGTRIVSKLLESGNAQIRCFCRSKNSAQKVMAIKNGINGSKVEIIIGNLVDTADVKNAVKNTDVIMHCAAAKGGPIASMYLNTVVGTRNLFEAAKINEKLKRIVHVSSFSVYDTASLKRHTTVDEKTPFEMNQKKRDDAYTYVKCKQELLCRHYQKKYKLPFVIARPGVVYGPGGDEISRRVGLRLFGLFLNIGKANLLPMVYVDNCADALVLAATVPRIEGAVINIHDDDLRTCNEFISEYKKKVKRIRTIKVPYSIFWIFSWMVEAYANYSKNQIPAVLSRNKVATNWKQLRFNNDELSRLLNWTQTVPTNEGLSRNFRYFKEINNLLG